jgi:ribosomal protein S18 acetylase RimI-like enzyme
MLTAKSSGNPADWLLQYVHMPVRPPASFELRDLRTVDYAAAMALWNSSPGVRTSESPEEFDRILARNPELSCAAVVAGNLVGAVLACHDGRRGYLYHLAVAEPHRYGGIARAMVERCLARLKAIGIDRCSIHLMVDNDGGAAFWQRIGWRERVDLKVMCHDL